MRKKEVFIILAFTVIAVGALVYMNRIHEIEMTDPNHDRHAPVKATLDVFYDEFMNNDHVTKKMERLFIGETTGKLAVFREDFGEIREYEIYQVKDKANWVKEAKVRVKTVLKNGRLQTIVDTFTIVGPRWLIYNYESTNKAMHPYLY